MTRQHGTCNVSDLTVKELIDELLNIEFSLDGTMSIVDGAHTYDIDGYSESMQDDDRLYDLFFDGDSILLNNAVVAKFKVDRD